MPPSNVPDTEIVPVGSPASPVLVGQLPVGGLVGGFVGGVVVGFPVGGAVVLVGGVVVPDEFTATSSKEAVEKAVCRPMRPLSSIVLLAEPTWVPSMVPRIVLPLTSSSSVYQV